ncbi:hypothetical protein T310_3498 [Rasamsonia emersonii CBS 393.64]|uniref:Uncharacterized protein n=1 Tax=Rasamsonia emersonii (strain ATCC 16479 / CBS 393.64 / IMI 116815) TaxID=1408163 RepID=A0A0F4YWL8_RASE3|nr:hypothetical protein T310_3498 [Rasamsonia emersonii CBS 393.64]KKA22500.1 hypothetical protein T310_3498 [Rasamsonia emersonii CBS 393.64]
MVMNFVTVISMYSNKHPAATRAVSFPQSHLRTGFQQYLAAKYYQVVQGYILSNVHHPCTEDTLKSEKENSSAACTFRTDVLNIRESSTLAERVTKQQQKEQERISESVLYYVSSRIGAVQ